nr:YebO family protein [Musicola keenii]
MSGLVSSMLEIVFVGLVVLLVILVWFFINRASVRANEQIRLLQEIVEQQKQQLVLLQSLVPTTEHKEEAEPQQSVPNEAELYLGGMIPER